MLIEQEKFLICIWDSLVGGSDSLAIILFQAECEDFKESKRKIKEEQS